MGYDTWQRFENPINEAIKNIELTEEIADNHITASGKVVHRPQGGAANNGTQLLKAPSGKGFRVLQITGRSQQKKPALTILVLLIQFVAMTGTVMSTGQHGS